jgi:hypothetical protein
MDGRLGGRVCSWSRSLNASIRLRAAVTARRLARLQEPSAYGVGERFKFGRGAEQFGALLHQPSGVLAEPPDAPAPTRVITSFNFRDRPSR